MKLSELHRQTLYDMKNIAIIIECSNDFHWVYADSIEGISAGGGTVQEAKGDTLEAIALQKELNNFPYTDYQLTCKCDAESVLQYFKGVVNNPAFERLTGINQKLIHQYAAGLKKPCAAQRQKIQEGLYKLGTELLSVQL